MAYILSLDEGTTSARAALYDREARRVAMRSAPTVSNFPNPGWVEQDANQIWSAQIDSVKETLAQAAVAPSDVAAIGITNQRETTVVWDRHTGEPIAPAIVWQCRRTAARCKELASHADAITAKTGLVVDAYFSGTKIAWILDNVAGARERANAGDLLFGNVDTWLIWKLTGGRVHATDPTNASRTMLFDLAGGDWDVVVNATAYTAVDKAESERDLAHAINAAGVERLALMCKAKGAPLIHVSTDYVFDGEKASPYLESDEPNPQSVYGASKLAGERAMRSEDLIVRISWVCGFHGGNMVKTILRLAESNPTLSFVSDQVGHPTFADDAARGMLALVEAGASVELK